MDKNAIKKYAVWARRELISRVSQRAALYEITDKDSGDASLDSVLGRVMSAEEKRQRQALIAQIREKGYEQVMEEIAYTWFNRFIALRFMEVNGYLPSRVRVFTDDENNFKPQILNEAINMELDGLNMEKVYALKNANDDDALFKYMIIVQCNALSSILPGMFQRLSDYTELLFPDNLLREGSVVEQMVSMIPEEDWTDQVQIIGWLYQYYNSELKDTVFAGLKKNKKISRESIPAATQLFTPDWIVRYMVENSLGRLWLEGHPNDELKASWKYYLDEAEQEPDVQTQLAEIRKEAAVLKPEDIRAIDPCQGSGHILAYMFDVLVQIYESYGYTAREAASSIVEHNIWGLDIDDRASQLAYFSVMMKARQYDRRFFSRGIQPHVYSILESNRLDQHCVNYFTNGQPELESSIGTLITELHDAKEYGSILDVSDIDFDSLIVRIDEIRREASPSVYSYQVLDMLWPLIKVAKAMAQKYHVVVTNPPYMGASNIGGKLNDYLKKNYPDSKSDMSTVCMEKAFDMCEAKGFVSMINIPVWMFLTSYEKLRTKFNRAHTIVNMVHPGRGIFGSDFGSVSFVFNKEKISRFLGTYRRLFDIQVEVKSPEAREEQFLSGKGQFVARQDDFELIPGIPVAYWVSQRKIKSFAEKKIGDYATVITGITIGDNNLYMRTWSEVPYTELNIGEHSMNDCDLMSRRWFPYNKGGEYRKWYGNNFFVVDWRNSGKFNRPKTTMREYYLRRGITWTFVSNQNLSLRYFPEGFLWDVQGSPIFATEKVLTYLLAFLNTKVANSYLSLISSTVCTQAVDIQRLPLIFGEDKFSEIKAIVDDCISISKADWDAFETSWDFKKHPLIRERTIQAAFDIWSAECEERFLKLRSNEEALNKIFIEIYGLENELSPEVEEKDVTVKRADLQREVKSFISYAVGCMLGRYNLERDGLYFAGGNWLQNSSGIFAADQDGILPISDDEYFEDDIVGRFVMFVETVYGKDTLEENLSFIAQALGGKGNSRAVIRDYFLNAFYGDHCTTYSVNGAGKRPIYWLFDSGKKNSFKCLIYMHRYQPDTIARIRTDYVHEQQSRYRTAIADLESRIANVGTGERVKLSRQLTKLQEQDEELRVYEEKIHHLADQMICIDLDDGVKHNYAIFQDVLAKIK